MPSLWLRPVCFLSRSIHKAGDPRYNIRVQNGGNYHVASAPSDKHDVVFFLGFFGTSEHTAKCRNADAGAGGTKVRKRFAEFVTLPDAYFFPSFHNSETSPRLSHAVRCVHIMTGTIS